MEAGEQRVVEKGKGSVRCEHKQNNFPFQSPTENKGKDTNVVSRKVR